MAVQKNRKSRSKRDMRRSHNNNLKKVTLSIDSVTGETHIRHHITADGYYRGRQIINTANAVGDSVDEIDSIKK